MADAFPQVARVKARCPDHPKCNRGLIFDLDCKRVLCLECRKPQDDHKHHKLDSIDIVLSSTDEQMQTIRNCYPQLDATLQASYNALRKERDADEQHADALIEAGDEWLVDAVSRLLQLTDRLRRVARQPHPKPVSPPAEGAAGWTLEEASALINKLKAFTARANNDENVCLTCDKEAPQLCEQMEMWMASAKRLLAETSCVPVSAVAQFKFSIQKCNEALTTLETDFGKVLERLTFWKKLSEISLISKRVINKEQLVDEFEKEKLYILGIAKAQAPNILYFCDAYKIKKFNLQTYQYQEVSLNFGVVLVCTVFDNIYEYIYCTIQVL